jgi:hypothetical protein
MTYYLEKLSAGELAFFHDPEVVLSFVGTPTHVMH